MEIYIVSRHGIYMRGIVGVYATEADAVEAMDIAKAEERDDYHDFQIDKEVVGVRIVGPTISVERGEGPEP